MYGMEKYSAINDHLIEELLKDPLYKIEPGKIYTKLTLNGQGVSKDWRAMGYKKKCNGYVRIRYKDNFLFVDRIMWRKFKGPLDSKLTIDHKDRNRENNHPDNLEQKSQGENNQNKRKKYTKHKKKASIIISKVIEKLKK